MTGVQTCALPICFPVTIKHRVGDRYDAKGFLLFEHEGVDKNLLELAKATRIPLETLYIRLRTQKLSVEEAIAQSTDQE